jgi:hypothetical protein
VVTLADLLLPNRPPKQRRRKSARNIPTIRRFYLHRDVDDTGVSGTGVVATGVLFDCGKVVTCWCSDASSVHQVSVWDSIAQVEAIHGHHGHTRVRWIDR